MWAKFDNNTHSPLSHLHSIAHDIHAGNHASIIATLHARSSSHWITVFLDVASQHISVGDSLYRYNTPISGCAALSPSNWCGVSGLAAKLGFVPKSEVNILPHAFQPTQNSYSYADITLNTMERRIFQNAAPWVEEFTHVLRAEWALLLVTGSRSPFNLVC